MLLNDWVKGNCAVGFGGSIAVKQMDGGAGDIFILTGLNIISKEISKEIRSNSVKH
ncbi:MAG TPA: hypothetical protein VMW53_12350 [archaeon]|nr:hypothetical protein [archaeon]